MGEHLRRFKSAKRAGLAEHIDRTLTHAMGYGAPTQQDHGLHIDRNCRLAERSIVAAQPIFQHADNKRRTESPIQQHKREDDPAPPALRRAVEEEQDHPAAHAQK